MVFSKTVADDGLEKPLSERALARSERLSKCHSSLIFALLWERIIPRKLNTLSAFLLQNPNLLDFAWHLLHVSAKIEPHSNAYPI